MRGKYESPRKGNPLAVIGIILALALVAGGIWYVYSSGILDRISGGDTLMSSTPSTTDPQQTSAPTDATTEPETEPETEPTEPEPVPLTEVASATIVTTGDILPHSGVQKSGLQSDGSYNFESIWTYVSPYITAADYAIANLETTLCGTDNGYKYSGYPQFNAPDELAQGAMDAGIDMLLTANNHCNDTGEIGITRTVSVVREIGLDTLGTVPDAEEENYRVVEVNGIKIGMMCYTYSTTNSNGRPAINGIPTSATSQYLVNTFDYGRLPAFYEEVQGYMDAMKEQGAEAMVMFIHWGVEYQLSANSLQKDVAQGLCDLGIDVIVGGHPHVIQPVDLLTSTTDEDHKTVCLYSLGNAVSNQRQGLISACSTAHTEDGMLFSITFTRYSDGSVALTATDILPCWVNRYNGTSGNMVYNILPLDVTTQDEWSTLYDLSDYELKCANASYERTMKLVGDGLTLCQTYLTESNEKRVEDYWNAQVNGDVVIDPATTLPASTVTDTSSDASATDSSSTT